jgi:LDH2 family malate/lactate/ureidoglycolate dehydrogenase
MAYDIEREERVNRYSEEEIDGFVRDFLTALGTTDAEAEIIADGLTTASMWWHPGQGQGLEKLFRYHRRVGNGGIVPDAPMDWERDGPSYALLDAAKGFGYVAAHRAMERAVKKATETGVAMVGVRDSNHFGIAGYHALQAVENGLVGWAFTNAKAEMAPWGSAEPVLGTNPWGIAVPRAESHPILLDMALTMSGKGMMRWYRDEGKEMPENWALTPDGRRTRDPEEAMDGPMLPIGEYKGYGLSLVTDVLSGVMTGALFGKSVFQDDEHFNVGHTMLAVDPEAFMQRDRFEERLAELVAEVQSAPPIDPDDPVRLPGELEFQRMADRREEGIPVAAETIEDLEPLATDLGIDFPL